MADPFFDSLNKSITDVVPLAMKKWEIDQRANQFEQELGIKKKMLSMEQQKFDEEINKIKQRNLFKEEVRKMMEPQAMTTPDPAALEATSAMPKGAFSVNPSLTPNITKMVTPEVDPRKILLSGLVNTGDEDYAKQLVELAKVKPNAPISVRPGGSLVDPVTGVPIFTAPAEDKKEKWSDPYEGIIGGKKVMLKRNIATNEVKPVVQDTSTTVRINAGQQGGTPFKELSESEKENAYKNFILNKVTPSFGMGASPDRKDWNAGLNKWMVANNVTPEDVATGRAAVKFQSATATLQNKAILTTIDPLLDQLVKSGVELGNSQIPGWNYLKNKFNEATGQPEIVAFKNLRDDTIAEVERGLLNTGVLSDTKYIRAANNVKDSQSFPQLKAAVDNMRKVIKARLEAIDKMSVAPANLQTGGASKNRPPLSSFKK